MQKACRQVELRAGVTFEKWINEGCVNWSQVHI